jgi:hypothetical protein
MLTLPLKRAKVQALAAGAPPPLPTTAQPPAPGNAAPPSAATPPTANNAQEAQRLLNIADEIRRRRGTRQMPAETNKP